jgi:hypothetical protein
MEESLSSRSIYVWTLLQAFYELSIRKKHGM